MERPDTLIMFSGGLDSTGVFWKLIKSTKKLHVHHLYLVNKENRAKAEDRAVSAIVAYMKNIREFGYSESYHEYPSYNGNFIFDSDIFSFMAGSICLSTKTIREVAIGMTASDMGSGLSERVNRANKIFESFGTKAQKVYPLMDMTKKQIYEMLPEDLRNMSWSCRTPIYEGDEIKECGRCRTCREIKLIVPHDDGNVGLGGDDPTRPGE
jgi:7-cyano-7-deazaguanine synthase in queuosine biosynthesis